MRLDIKSIEYFALIFIYIVILFPLFIFVCTTLINALFGPYLRKRHSFEASPLVSVIIPARNEENNIANILDYLSLQTYDNIEIIVVDDASDDSTGEIVLSYSEKHPTIVLLRAPKPPDKALGKPNACAFGAARANGDYIIFVDADVELSPFAIENSLGWMMKFNLDFLSALPEQKNQTFSEKLFVPIVDALGYSSFILWSSLFVKIDFFAVANGQWIVVRKSAYEKCGGHSSVSDKIVEDVELAKLFKRKKFRILSLAGTGVVYSRMYENFEQIKRGFSKNLFGISANNAPLFFILLGVFFIAGVGPYLSLFCELKLAYYSLALVAVWKTLFSIVFKHNFFISAILHPIQYISFIYLALISYFKTKYGSIEWKGRKIRAH